MSPAARRMLVIDDEKGLRDMLRYALSRLGYQVELACHGREAVEKARDSAFDLAICDLTMPEMDGIETLRALKALQPALEVVIVTGYATVEGAEKAVALGAFDYLAKPYELDQLSQVLDRAWAHRHQEVA